MRSLLHGGQGDDIVLFQHEKCLQRVVNAFFSERPDLLTKDLLEARGRFKTTPLYNSLKRGDCELARTLLGRPELLTAAVERDINFLLF